MLAKQVLERLSQALALLLKFLRVPQSGFIADPGRFTHDGHAKCGQPHNLKR